VSTTPGANLPLVSKTPAANFATSFAIVVDTGGKYATGVTIPRQIWRLCQRHRCAPYANPCILYFLVSCVYEASKEMISFSEENTYLWVRLFGSQAPERHSYSSVGKDNNSRLAVPYLLWIGLFFHATVRQSFRSVIRMVISFCRWRTVCKIFHPMGIEGWCLKKCPKTLLTNKKQGKMRSRDATNIIKPSKLSSNQNKYFYFNIKPEEPPKISKTQPASLI
jgi:hypothetical protein